MNRQELIDEISKSILSNGKVKESTIVSLVRVFNGNDDVPVDFHYLVIDSIFMELGVSKSELLGRSRKRELSDARLIFYKIMMDTGCFTLFHVGSKINRCHSSVLSGLKRCNGLIESNSVFAKMFIKVEASSRKSMRLSR